MYGIAVEYAPAVSSEGRYNVVVIPTVDELELRLGTVFQFEDQDL
jgi:hypothetical protein